MDNTNLLILTVGIPGVGKSTWAKNYQRHHPNTIVISNDEIRKELDGSDNYIKEKSPNIYAEARKRAKKALQEGHDVIIDGTNVDSEIWASYKLEVCQPETLMIARLFNKPPKKATAYLRHRSRKIPVEILEKKWQILEENKPLLSKFFIWIDEDMLF